MAWRLVRLVIYLFLSCQKNGVLLITNSSLAYLLRITCLWAVAIHSSNECHRTDEEKEDVIGKARNGGRQEMTEHAEMTAVFHYMTDETLLVPNYLVHML